MDQFKTPANKPPPMRSGTSTKRDSLAAELERDPQLSTSKRMHRTNLFTSSLSHSSLERQLLAAQTAKIELETKLRDRELQVERLERDRAYFADREGEARKGWDEEREAREEEKRQSTSEIRTLRSTLSSLRDELADLNDTHASLSRSTTHALAASKTQISTLTHTAALLQSELSQTTALLAERTSSLQNLQSAYDDLLATQTAQTQAGVDEENMRVVREELVRQSGYMGTLEDRNRRLEAEVRVLRERERSVGVVREEKRDLERRVKGVEELRRRVVELEREREGWVRRERRDVDGGMMDVQEEGPSKPSDTPVSLTHTLSELRLAHARLLDTHGAALASLHAAQASVGELKEVGAGQGKEIRKLRDEVEVLREEKGRVERAVGMCEREVGFMKALVASYDAEQNLVRSHHAQGHEDGDMSMDGTLHDGTLHDGDNDTPHDITITRLERIQQLEALLEEYKAVNAELREELGRKGRRRFGGDGVGGGEGREEGEECEGEERGGEGREGEDVKPVVTTPRIEELQKEVEELRVERDALKKELESTLTTLDTTEQALFELQGEVGAGRHVPPRVRILAMRDNPEEEWFRSRGEVIERLKGENEALRERLREVGRGGVVSGGVSGGGDANTGNDARNQSLNSSNTNTNTNPNASSNPNASPNPPLNPNSLLPPESYSSLLSDLSSLQSLVAQKDKRLQRLQSIFTSKSAEFRDAIASILGVKLAFYPNGGVRVTSVYDLYASFVFQPGPSGSGVGSSGNGGGGSGSGNANSNANGANANANGGTANANPNDEDNLRTMQLIAQGEGGPEDVGNMMEYWIGKEQCIPGFMASVTLECWEKRRRER